MLDLEGVCLIVVLVVDDGFVFVGGRFLRVRVSGEGGYGGEMGCGWFVV